ncbi:hypothetical protein ACFFOS_05040 [Nocardioides kongjuensis]|uniref:LppX_LprAFG lipoprotein n=1 Tax=Nocardioides kongjuensis TaxID=349522 RepID=A0A852RKA8_9ACTN|nr:hypothetical protein [Nocardioides kongjuensis]NYD28534.1 hypothetical protein [Nocardioides kongjuensis]
MNRRTALPAVVLLTSSVLLAGCGGDDEPQRPSSTPTAASSSGRPTPFAHEGTTQDAGPVLDAVAAALRTAGRVKVSASLAGGPARELTIDTTQVAAALDAVTVEQLVHIGPEQVGGVATEHYRITLDPRAALAGITLPAQVQAMLPDTLDADVWLDGQSRPVKVTAEPGVELALSYDLSAP